jgi:hypothetical protein
MVLNLHGDDGADAGQAIDHNAGEGVVEQAREGRGVDACERAAGLFLRQHRSS